MNPVILWGKTNFVLPCPTPACFSGQCEAVATARVETKDEILFGSVVFLQQGSNEDM